MDTAIPALEAKLSAAGCQQPARAAKTLEQLGGAPETRGSLEALLPSLLTALRRVPDPDLALNNLDRFSRAVLDRRFLFGLLRDHPPVLHLVLTILGSSQFLGNLLIRQPQLFEWLLEPGMIRQPKRRADLFEEAAAALVRRPGLAQQWAALRRFKSREILRIGIQDLVGRQTLVGITEELSNLADAVLETACRLCRQELSRRHGPPQLPGPPPRECRFVIMGMGKLGGGELNFSSDIDPIFVYEGEGETAGVAGAEGGPTGRLSNQEFFRKLGEMLVRGLSEVSADGNLYRVDLRLRPEGRSGAIASSLASCEAYYEGWGQTWERQALIKARPVAGDLELGEAFLRMVRPFVYRQSLDYTALDEIRAMKSRIGVAAAEGGERRNVKLGYGGIREIEFLVQGLQLVFGGRNPWIREANTLRALHRLASQRLISDADYESLVRAYSFLRKLEHRLQILHDRQTHTLPATERELMVLARRMGYQPPEWPDPAGALQAEYERHTTAVRGLYDAFLGGIRPPEDVEGLEASADPASLFFTAALAPEQLRERVAGVGFEDPERALRNLQLLRDGQSSAAHVSGVRRALGALAPALLEALAAVPDPDLALSGFERFVASLGAQSTYLTLLDENPDLLRRLAILFGTSEFLAGWLVRYPELVDALLSPEPAARRGKEALQGELTRALQAAESPSLRLDALRRLKKAEELRIGLQDILGRQDVTETHRALSNLADACLQAALLQAERDLAPRFGGPEPRGVGVIGMGKLGGRELGYASDLDIVFVYRGEGQTDGAERISHPEYFSKLADRVGKILSTITQEGAAYRVDMRLRPGGQKGELAQSLEGFARHFARMADLWERQAYVKARAVAGDPALLRDFERLVEGFVYGAPPLPDLAAQIHAMRQRMETERGGGKGAHVKLGSGGIVDIEFLVQYLQLRHGGEVPAVRSPGTLEALRALEGAGLLAEADGRTLAEAYRFLRRVENRLRIVADLSVSTLPAAPGRLETLARRMGYAREGGIPARERFLGDFAATTARVRAIYLRVLGLTGGADRGGEAGHVEI